MVQGVFYRKILKKVKVLLKVHTDLTLAIFRGDQYPHDFLGTIM